MENRLKEKIKAIINTSELQEIIKSEEFYFQKAVDKYYEFMSLPQLTQQESDRIINEVQATQNFTFNGLVSKYTEDSKEYVVLKTIGELVAYLDSKAANKDTYNEYDDKRVVAAANVFPQIWVKSLLLYKMENDIKLISSDNIRNIIKYISDPENNIDIISPRHRLLISLIMLDTVDLIGDLKDIVFNQFKELNIEVKNERNRSTVYSTILYNDEMRKIWNFRQNIWKISHGNDEDFTENQKKQYLREKIIIVQKDKIRGQADNFINKMKVGDFFYLCYSKMQVKLLGIITSESRPLEGNEDSGWMQRSYEIIKESINNDEYTGVLKGWSPNYTSTCILVKDEHLNLFQKELLIPYFDIKLSGLIKHSTSEDFASNDNIENNSNEDGRPDENGLSELNSMYKSLNYILYGPPGTGKTYNCVNYAVAIIDRREYDQVQCEDYKNVKRRFDELKKNKQIVFTTFHQSYGYEEFIEGIKPKLDGTQCGDLTYVLQKGIFRELCENAEINLDKNYVIIIDEINRGNISKIFGELITLIEPTKRIDEPEEIKVKLPYSKREFGITKNIYILGTMNTADRSIALLDTALRRRFKFIEMMPNTNILKRLNEDKSLIIEGIDIKKMLDTINERIEVLYDREHTIGHAYFTDLISNKDFETLQYIFIEKIVPLLQEYFYDDYEKIRLILADNQFQSNSIQFINVTNISKDLFGEKTELDILEDKKIYTINETAFTDPNAFIKIYDAKYNGSDIGNV